MSRKKFESQLIQLKKDKSTEDAANTENTNAMRKQLKEANLVLGEKVGCIF